MSSVEGALAQKTALDDVCSLEALPHCHSQTLKAAADTVWIDFKDKRQLLFVKEPCHLDILPEEQE